MKRGVLIGLLLICGAWIAWSWFASSSGHRELSLPADSIVELEMDTSFGNVSVVGRDGAEQITAQAEIRSRWIWPQPRVKFELVQEGDRAVLTLSKKQGWFGFRFGFGPMADVRVEVPSSLKVSINDGSGDLEVRNIGGGLKIEDESGDLIVEQVRGGLTIRDDSGNMQVRDVHGDTWIEDDSGNIDIWNVTGDLRIEDDSGNLSIRDVTGTVTVNDGSGNINISQVDGDVVIEEDGSGKLNVSGVKGNIVKPN